MTYDWDKAGAEQQLNAVLGWYRKIKRPFDHYWLKYRAFTGDVDYTDADAGDPPKGR